jgi:LysR family glycine cleavage system transcriptional activator
LQAAMDGLGVALGRARIVEADIAAGRLVVPFATVTVPAEAGYYLVGPAEVPPTPRIELFRAWLMATTARERGNATAMSTS